MKAGRNGTVPEIMALAADRRSSQMDRPGVEMAYLLLRSLRRTHPEAAVEAQKLYDTLMADLIAGTTTTSNSLPATWASTTIKRAVMSL